MKRTYEIYEDNGGGLHMVILNDGQPIKIYSGWEQGDDVPGILIDALDQVKADPAAHYDWDGDLMQEIAGRGETCTIEDLYRELTDADPYEVKMIATVDAAGVLTIDRKSIGYNGMTAFGLDDEF